MPYLTHELLKNCDITYLENAWPDQLSGGESQRVALCRALITTPPLILADEPTGNLDSKNSDRIIKLIRELHRVKQATIVLVTHETQVANQSQRILTLEDGQIIADRKSIE